MTKIFVTSSCLHEKLPALSYELRAKTQNIKLYMSNHYDIIIVGTWRGSTIAYKLAPAKRILILERGGFIPKGKELRSTSAVTIGRYRPKR
jgi:hypothetical protein